MQKLSNDELAENIRAANRRRSERQRAKRVKSGKAALTVWIPAELQRQVVERAAASGTTTSEIVTAALVAHLADPTRVEPTPAPPDTLQLFEPGEPNETTSPFLLPDPIQSRAMGRESATDRDTAILKLHNQGLSNVAIGRELGCNEASVRRALKRLGAAS